IDIMPSTKTVLLPESRGAVRAYPSRITNVLFDNIEQFRILFAVERVVFPDTPHVRKGGTDRQLVSVAKNVLTGCYNAVQKEGDTETIKNEDFKRIVTKDGQVAAWLSSSTDGETMHELMAIVTVGKTKYVVRATTCPPAWIKINIPVWEYSIYDLKEGSKAILRHLQRQAPEFLSRR
ncbi:MAG: hypothetical protein ACHQX1_03620, partial [Candidatus Micrarchaeales archaeon]